MCDFWMDVDTAVTVPVNLLPLLDDTDFKSIEPDVAYDAAGMDLVWHFVTCAGIITATAVTPTTGGNYDWAEDVANKGTYKIEIPASGGASINNDTEGFGWFTGVATGILPWRGPVIGFRRAALNDLLIEGGTASTNLEDFFDGTGYAGGTAKLTVDAVAISGDTTAADNLEAACDGNTYNVGGGAVVAASVTAAVTLAAGQLTFKKNVAHPNFMFPMFDSAGALVTGLTVTTEICKDAGAAFVALADSASEIGTSGWYRVDFAQAETNAADIAFKATAEGANPTNYTIIPQA